MSKQLPDVQNTVDPRGIEIQRVGVTNVYFPVKVKKKDNGFIPVSAKIDLFVGLPKEYKGLNMSRFSESLIEFTDVKGVISKDTMPLLLEILGKKLNSKDVWAKVEFDYYVEKKTPSTKKDAPMMYRCAFTGIKKNGDEDITLITEVNVIAASVCPCSKEMSLLQEMEFASDFRVNVDPMVEKSIKLSPAGKCVGMGAHNQRSLIRLEAIAKDKKILWFEDLIKIVEEQASAPTYTLLKRSDEKAVTEAGYKNPKFVEDIARDLHVEMMKNEDIQEWSIRVKNEESIHPFDVIAYLHSENWKFH